MCLPFCEEQKAKSEERNSEQLLRIVHEFPVQQPRLGHQLMLAQWTLLVVNVQDGVTMCVEIVAHQHAMALEVRALGAHDGGVARVPFLTCHPERSRGTCGSSCDVH